MEFTFRCPKCRGLDFRIETDQKVFVDNDDMRVFTCRCGKQLFGKMIDEERARQEEFAKAIQPKPPNPIAVRLREERKRSEEAHRQLLEKVRRRDEMWAAESALREQERVQQKEEERRLQREQRELEERKKEVLCAWPGCGQPRRTTSVYCSRACSNKNAHARERARISASSSEPAAGEGTCGCHGH